MRILIVGAYHYPATCYGGPVWVVKELARGLAARGLQVEVVTTSANEPVDDPPRTDMLDDVLVHYEARLPPKGWFFSPGVLRTVARRVSAVDLVYVHGVWVWPVVASCLAARIARRPYVMVPHGSFDDWAMRRKALKKRLYLDLIERRNLRHAAAIHCLTRREADQVRQLVPEARCVVIPNAATIDPSPVPDSARQTLLARFPELRGKRLVLFLSRLHIKKGLDLLVPAFQRIAARHSDAHLVLAGPDERGYRTVVESLVRRHGLEERVTFTGLVNGDEKRALFQAADLFVLPSYSEGLPVVVLEALAMGLPVVITRECNLDDEVRTTGAGVIVDTSIESIAEGMGRVLNSPRAAQEMAAAGRRLAQTRFSLESVTGQLIPLFQRIIEEP